MAPPSRDQIEQMAFMAMMDGIIHTSVPCSCATCKSEGRSRGTRPQPLKRSSESQENTKLPTKSENSGTCNHNHSAPEPKPSTNTNRKSAPQGSPNKSNSSSASTSGRMDKINALLKADNVPAVFEVLNQTSTSKDEMDLAARIQNATKDCKLYQETKDRILELCDDDSVDLDAVFGLLVKFRYERNMVTTALLKGNTEREKALLCIQRVDHLMYLLQDVAKKKDSKGSDVMHKLGDIIMEIHDLAKTPSTLYDEFLDIKEEHFDLLSDHEEMHQKFVDVNSCHEKLHSSHDKLQTEHTKLLRDLTEAKKKAGTVGGLKNDISRLEKAVDKSSTENVDLRKEVDKLNAELAKVNALKHENAQLKKKITTLSIQTPPPEDTPMISQVQASKKKKGKKPTSDSSNNKSAASETLQEPENRVAELEKEHEAQVTKMKRAHDSLAQELELVRNNLKQLETFLRKAETARDKAAEKLEVERATSQNWKDIAKGNSSERDRLQAEIERHVTKATRLQFNVEELEQTLNNTKIELIEQAEARKQLKEEMEHRAPTPAMSVASQQTASLNSDTIRLLRKIRSETSQLARDLEDSKLFGGEVYPPLDMIQVSVRRVAFEVEKDIEEILSVKGNELSTGHNCHVPEAVLPFSYNNIPSRQTPQFPSRAEYSPQELPRVPSSTSLPPFRPMPPPPGFSEPSPMPFNQHTHNQIPHYHNQNRVHESPSAPFSRIVEPPGLSTNLGFNRSIESLSATAPRFNPIAPPSSSFHAHPTVQGGSTLPNPNVGVIGSRSTHNKQNATPSPISTPAPSVSSGTGVSSSNATGNGSTSGLGNGAVGVDWNIWARSGR